MDALDCSPGAKMATDCCAVAARCCSLLLVAAGCCWLLLVAARCCSLLLTVIVDRCSGLLVTAKATDDGMDGQGHS